jgi:hypothetical protein
MHLRFNHILQTFQKTNVKLANLLKRTYFNKKKPEPSDPDLCKWASGVFVYVWTISGAEELNSVFGKNFSHQNL